MTIKSSMEQSACQLAHPTPPPLASLALTSAPPPVNKAAGPSPSRPTSIRPRRSHAVSTPNPCPSSCQPSLAQTGGCEQIQHPLLSLGRHVPRWLRALLGQQEGAPADRNTILAKRGALIGLSLLMGGRLLGKLVRRSLATGPDGRADMPPFQAGIVWMRSDLRTSDHEPLMAAVAQCRSLVPLYCFDPWEYSKDASSFERTGPGRARFIIESVESLRQQLRSLGSDLIVRVGHPHHVVPQLAAQTGAKAVYCHCDASSNASQAEASVRAVLQQMGVQLKVFWGGSTLFHAEDLPFLPSALPSSYAHFSRALADVPVRSPSPTPAFLRRLPPGINLEPGHIPSLAQLGFMREAALSSPSRPGPASIFGTGRLRGGEAEALQHLLAFIADVKAAAAQQQERLQSGLNGWRAGQGQGQGQGQQGSRLEGCSAGPAFSCKISPWLALGCISPRTVYHAVREQLGLGNVYRGEGAAEEERSSGGGVGPPQQQQALGASWLMFELLWRDFYRLHASTPNGLAAS